ncbi:MAG: single-stranded-DNA-specific exonuclease RecJ [Bacteroidetes bacterium]|nr:single-stranded-DNA-specific exonuclease RecJ [Bacteroidota bacterium]MBS1540683.1 single-stranded-DNA-specific exonuclease RecJ [Bacteroidota bacterium]
MEKRWLYHSLPAAEEIQELGKTLNINSQLTTLLWQRGHRDFETAKNFFRPSLSHLHDPFLMKDMELAVTRLKKAIDDDEKILVYGDYDVDGTTAVSMVYRYLKSFYPHCHFYIPDRYSEGYGVSPAGIMWAEENGCTLIIALDLGIKAADMVTLASHKGIDFIICDHHLPGGDIPQAVAVLDPKRKDCQYPFNELSGCGLGFKLLQAFARRFRDENEVYEFLDLVAVSIASDIVPITGENRVLAYFGLQKLNQNPRPGLKALKEIAAIKNDMDISAVVFTLGPRINAAGRVAHARAAVELLISQTEAEANDLAEKINTKNDLRREYDLSITEEAIAMIEQNETLRNAKSTVLFKDTWHKGVIGIVAARCVEKYHRPTVILTQSNDKITGSARSVKDFDLYQALESCSEFLEKYGGHKYAAGLTLERQNVLAFQKKFEEVVSSSITDEMQVPLIEIDLTISLETITPKFIAIVKQMAPFGPENQKPVFEARNLQVVNSLSSFKDKHVRFLVGQKGNDSIFQVVGFDQVQHYQRLAAGDTFRMAFSIEENQYNGITSVQLRTKDIKFD